MAGDSPTAAQLLALTFGLATPVVLVLMGLERGLRVIPAFLAGVLLATAPAHIHYSTYLKQYTGEAFFSTLTIWAAWRTFECPSARRWTLLVATAVATGLLSAVGAVAAATAVSVALGVALLRRPMALKPALLGAAVFAAAVGAWLILAVRPNLDASLQVYWRGYFLTGSGFAGGLAPRSLALARSFQPFNWLTTSAVAAAAIVVLWRRPRVGVLLVAPTVVAIALAALGIVPIGTGRTDIYLFPSFALLGAVAVDEIITLLVPHRAFIKVVTLACMIGLVAVATPASSDAYIKEDVAWLVRLVEQRRDHSEPIAVYAQTAYAYGLATKYPIDLAPEGGAVTLDGGHSGSQHRDTPQCSEPCSRATDDRPTHATVLSYMDHWLAPQFRLVHHPRDDDSPRLSHVQGVRRVRCVPRPHDPPI